MNSQGPFDKLHAGKNIHRGTFQRCTGNFNLAHPTASTPQTLQIKLRIQRLAKENKKLIGQRIEFQKSPIVLQKIQKITMAESGLKQTQPPQARFIGKNNISLAKTLSIFNRKPHL